MNFKKIFQYLVLISAVFLISAKSYASGGFERQPISVFVNTEIIASLYGGGPSPNVPYAFNASVSGEMDPAAAYLFGKAVDVYFGILTPDQQAFSWILNPNTSSRNAIGVIGFRPILTNYIASGAYSMEQIAVSQKFAYPFTSSDKLGLYTVFCILVYAGKDPSKPENWSSVGMSPFLLTK